MVSAKRLRVARHEQEKIDALDARLARPQLTKRPANSEELDERDSQ